MSEEEKNQTSRPAWSFPPLQRLPQLGAGMMGRTTVVVAGCFSMMVGVLLTFTLCGAVIGVPLFVFGFLLVARGLF